MRYVLELARTGLRLRHKRAHAALVREFVSWMRVEFLRTAAQVGLLAALAPGPRRLDDLVDELGGVDRDLLGSLLEVGVAVHELRRRGDRWQLASPRARAMVDPAV